MAPQKPGPKSDTKFETPDGNEIKFAYKKDEITDGRQNVDVGGVSVGFIQDTGHGWDSFIDPAQEGSGFGAYRQVAKDQRTRKDAAQALADALAKHAAVNVLAK